MDVSISLVTTGGKQFLTVFLIMARQQQGRPALSDFLSAIYAIDNNIKFTLKVEENSTLPFSGVLIMEKKWKPILSVYRRFVKLNYVIPFNASLLFNCVLSSFKKRIFLVCSNDQLQESLISSGVLLLIPLFLFPYGVHCQNNQILSQPSS